MNKKRHSVLIVISSLLVSCGYMAVHFAPDKRPSEVRSDASKQADVLFWQMLHGGEYDRIPDALAALTAAYLDDPTDSTTASHIGFLHIWRLAECSRLETVPSTITDHAVLARKYFKESAQLNSTDARVLGFLGAATVVEGTIHKDEGLIREGYYTLVESIHAWPEFNYFTAGFVMSRMPVDSAQFQEGLEWQWRNLHECANEKVDRKNPDFAKNMQFYTTEGKKRVCWNSWIAPHNMEGFFLNMGDMLVKAGDWHIAQRIYANAKLSPDYAGWKFRPVLEDRIKHAEGNVILFNTPEDPTVKTTNSIMINSRFACMGCHQK